MTLGEKIQELRRKRGMSQDVLAEKLEVSRQAVSKWERDEAVPETEKIIRLAQEFQVSIDYLLLSKEEPARPEPAAAPAKNEPSAGQQVLRSVRRHGYKAGYGMMVWGAVLCVLAILIALLISGFATGSFKLFGGFTDSAQNMVGNMGIGGGEFIDGYFGMVDQQLGQMETVWTGTARLMTWLVSGTMGLIGLALIVGGVVVTVKGKKVAQAVK